MVKKYPSDLAPEEKREYSRIMRLAFPPETGTPEHINRLEFNRLYGLAFAKEISEKNKRYWDARPEKYREKCKRHSLSQRTRNPEKVKARIYAWRLKQSPGSNFKIRELLRGRIHCALNLQGAKKAKSTHKLIGCSPEFLRSYIENQFKSGMTWENHGFYGWHIDHIRPCASFDLTEPGQQLDCFHYTNLQPLWWRDNLIKADTYVP